MDERFRISLWPSIKAFDISRLSIAVNVQNDSKQDKQLSLCLKDQDQSRQSFEAVYGVDRCTR